MNPPTLDTYLSLITSEHNQQPKFMATVAAEIQPFVDLMATLNAMIGIFNPNAQGDQLDKVGVWAGAERNLDIALNDVWFSLDAENVGLDEGTLFGPDDSRDRGLTVLPDDSFQILIKLTIAMNNWDGTVPGAYTLWDSVFAAQGWGLVLQDYQDMTMAVLFLGNIQNIVAQSLIVNGYFNLKPAGVRIIGYYQPAVQGEPVFGLDAENSLISGLDVGYLAQEITA